MGSTPHLVDRVALEAGVVDLARRCLVRADGVQVRLTVKESALLAVLASQPDRPLTREALLHAVWDDALPGDTRTVYSTVERLRRKLELQPSRPHHILTVRGVGYRFRPGTPRVADRVPALPEPTRFVGRTAELAQLEALFRGGARLVTLLGAGGIGKTRLARHYGTLAEARFQAVWFCDLAAARSEDDLAEALSAALGVPAPEGPAGPAIAALAQGLDGRSPGLLIVDNFEQLAPLAPLLGPILERACVLATSRESLRIRGEHRLVLGPLSEAEAVALFADRARAVSSDPTDDRDAAQLVERLDRIPLAIELAAPWVRVLSASDLLARLGRSFDLLVADGRDGPARHATLDAAFACSWDLLEREERRALARVSVFRGGFFEDAAEAVLGPAALRLLRALVDRSLLATRAVGERARFFLYETIRVAADARLDALGEREEAESLRDAHFVELGSALGGGLRPFGTAEVVAAVALERANLAAVYERSLASHPERAVRIALVLHGVPSIPHSAFVTLLDTALGRAGELPPELQLTAYYRRAAAARDRSDAPSALADLEIAQRAARQLGDRRSEVRVLRLAAGCRRLEAGGVRVDQPPAELYEAMAVLRELGDRAGEAGVWIDLSDYLLDAGSPDAAEAIQTARALAQSPLDERMLAINQINHGILHLEGGALDTARESLESALALLQRLGNRRLEGHAHIYRAAVAHFEGALPEAAASYRLGVEAIGEAEGPVAAEWAWLAAALADGDRIAEAEEALDEARRVARNPHWELLAGAHLALARWRRAMVGPADEAPPGEAFALAQEARAEAERTRIATGESYDLRLRLALLERARAEAEQLWAVAGDASWFRGPDGARVALEGRPSLRGILAALVEHRERAPGEPLSVEALTAAGWPGERILEEAAANRVYAAVAALRRLGLRGLIETAADGYFAAPAARVLRG